MLSIPIKVVFPPQSSDNAVRLLSVTQTVLLSKSVEFVTPAHHRPEYNAIGKCASSVYHSLLHPLGHWKLGYLSVQIYLPIEYEIYDVVHMMIYSLT